MDPTDYLLSLWLMPCRSKESDHLSTLYISECRFHIKRSLKKGALLYFSSCSFFFTVFVIKQKRAHDGNSYIYDIGMGWDGIFRLPLFLSFNGFYCWLYHLFLVSNSIKPSNAPVQSILFLYFIPIYVIYLFIDINENDILHWSFCVNNLRHLHYRYFFFICQRNTKIYIEFSLHTHLIKNRFDNMTAYMYQSMA